jgi:beta-glucosidase
MVIICIYIIINNGTVTGAEVLQLYIKFPLSAPTILPKQLREFTSISLVAMESTTATFELTRKDLNY